MGISVDMSDVGDVSFDALPSGQYLVGITNGEVRQAGPEAKHPGSEYISWELTVQEPSEFAGRKLFTNTSLLPQALFGLKALLLATEKFDEASLDAQLDFDIEDVVGSVITVTARKKKYQGDDTNEVKKFKPASSFEASAADDSLMP